MNVRYRVICERIKARARVQEWEPHRVFSVPPATEEEIRVTEKALGFPLPPMLRTLYMEVANGGDNLIHPESHYTMIGAHANRTPEEEERIELYSARGSLEQNVSRSGWRFPPETVEALRRYRGAHVDCSDGDGGFKAPDGFIYLAFMGCEVGLYLDGHTGHLYLEDWGHVSFCAPSVEDWLERDLDASLSVVASYHPHVELKAAIAADEQRDRAAEQLSPTELTRRLREENLADDAPAPIADATNRFNIVNGRLAKLGDQYPPAVAKRLAKDNRSALNGERVKNIGARMRQQRQHLIRHLYELMDVLEDEVAEAEGEPVGEERFIKGLLSLIEAEANLAHTTWDIQMGLSVLYERSRRDWRTGKVYPDSDQTDQ